MQISPIKTRVFRKNEDLTAFILKYVKNLKENSVLVVTSKIVALSEGRTREYKNEKQKIELIKQESEFSLKTKDAWLTIKDGMVLANAGIDESNAKNKMILLPKDSFKSAEILRKKLMKKFRLKNFGVLVTDSGIFPMRAGVVGMALGYAGFQGIRHYEGTKDIFKKELKFSRTDVADSLATSAVLCMGEGNEQQPLALITDAPVRFVNKVNKKELLIDPHEDLYQPLFEKIKKIKFRKDN